MRETRNVEDWNPAGEYVYTKACRLGPPENPFTKVGDPVDMEALRTVNKMDNRRIRALFMQGKIAPAPKVRKKREKTVGRDRPQSKFASASTADATAEE